MLAVYVETSLEWCIAVYAGMTSAWNVRGGITGVGSRL